MSLWIELPWPENPANTCAWHTVTLDSGFDLIRSHQQCIPWSPPLEIEPATTECRAETLMVWWDLIRSKQLSSVSVCHAQVFAGFSGHANSIPQFKKKIEENVHLYPCLWGYNNYADAYFQSSWEDVALEVTMSSEKSTDVTCKTHSGHLTAQLLWLVNLVKLVCDVEEFRLCILWSVVRSPVEEITVYTPDET